MFFFFNFLFGLTVHLHLQLLLHHRFQWKSINKLKHVSSFLSSYVQNKSFVYLSIIAPSKHPALLYIVFVCLNFCLHSNFCRFRLLFFSFCLNETPVFCCLCRLFRLANVKWLICIWMTTPAFIYAILLQSIFAAPFSGTVFLPPFS